MEAVEISGFHFRQGAVIPVVKLAQELMLVISQQCISICLDETPNSENGQSLYSCGHCKTHFAKWTQTGLKRNTQNKFWVNVNTQLQKLKHTSEIEQIFNTHNPTWAITFSGFHRRNQYYTLSLRATTEAEKSHHGQNIWN